MDIKNTYLYKKVKNYYLKWIHIRCDIQRKPLIADLKEFLGEIGNKEPCENNQLSIISSNCFAGRIMQDLNMKYNSPTLGLYFMYPDYIEFLKNLRYYLTEAKIEFVEHSKYKIGDERREAWSHWYPIGLLDGRVEIHFLHYHSEDEAAEKWYRRASRVNWDNLLVVGMQQNLCGEQDLIDFDKLPFKNKVMFANLPIELDSIEYVEEFKGKDAVGDPYRKAPVFYRHLISHFKNRL